MGSYFSLRGAGEWDAAISLTKEPSIWTNVAYAPLSRGERVLWGRRSGDLVFAYPTGLCYGDDVIKVSDTADVSLLIAFDECRGHLYSAVLLHAPLVNQPHIYCKGATNVSLRAPSENSLHEKRMSRGLSDSSSVLFSQDSHSVGQEALTDEIHYPYVLLYAVKEGVLAYCGMDYRSCENVVRAIAGSRRPAGQSQNCGRAFGTDTGSAEGVTVKCVCQPLGRAPPPVARELHHVISDDLKRQFEIRTDMRHQAQSTNCVVFCIRVMQSLTLSLRGYDIQKECENRADLGPNAGEAVGDAWEALLKSVRV